MSWFILILRVVIGVIFIVAGAAKVGHAAEFAAQIAGFRILPQVVIAPMALALPFLEILLGGYLIVGLFTRAAAWIAVILFATFDLAIASAVVRGMTVSCGCFGPNDKTVTTWAEVARDAVFVLIALVVALRPPGTLALDRRIGNAP
ncbi:MAG: DoxX family membrane protein [Candidatus Eremiobacteraeota bacterium]|nr:DoxX family membrane protein [Candidatus Eremiobacteraeota bacterium]MBV9408349.1 DoxX family membrane protein [Candidatus Eremiobacteraeota bacterium]